MTEVITPTPEAQPAATDLATAAQRILAASSEPLTLSKIRSRLPAAQRSIDLKELADVLQRQVAANVLYQYPRYRSPQERYWDRSMPVHIAQLIREALAEAPLPWSELRRKLPAYAQAQAQSVLEQQLAEGLLHRHPRVAARSSERIGLRPPDPKDYLRNELPGLFDRLTHLGFTRGQVRAAAIELLHEEEWEVAPAGEETPGPAPGSVPPPQETPAATTSLGEPHHPDLLSPGQPAETQQEQTT
jgi:hypothetical protein